MVLATLVRARRRVGPATAAPVGRAWRCRPDLATGCCARWAFGCISCGSPRLGRGPGGGQPRLAGSTFWCIAATAPVVPVAKCEVAGLAGDRSAGPPGAAPSSCRGDRCRQSAQRGRADHRDPPPRSPGPGVPGGHDHQRRPAEHLFHRAAFQAAVDAAVPVAPVAIGYADGRGRPTTSCRLRRATIDLLVPRLWRVAARPGRGGPPDVSVVDRLAPAPSCDGGHRTSPTGRGAGLLTPVPPRAPRSRPTFAGSGARERSPMLIPVCPPVRPPECVSCERLIRRSAGLAGQRHQHAGDGEVLVGAEVADGLDAQVPGERPCRQPR